MHNLKRNACTIQPERMHNDLRSACTFPAAYAVYIAYYKMSRRERYLEERDKENGVMSYDALDNNGLVGQEMFQDKEKGTLEEMALAKELLEQLHRCIQMLPKAERDLIKSIYFDGMSDREYANKVGKSQPAVSSRHKKTLSKLKMLLDFMGSF